MVNFDKLLNSSGLWRDDINYHRRIPVQHVLFHWNNWTSTIRLIDFQHIQGQRMCCIWRVWWSVRLLLAVLLHCVQIIIYGTWLVMGINSISTDIGSAQKLPHLVCNCESRRLTFLQVLESVSKENKLFLVKALAIVSIKCTSFDIVCAHM